jgi:hypothetical protein
MCDHSLCFCWRPARPQLVSGVGVVSDEGLTIDFVRKAMQSAFPPVVLLWKRHRPIKEPRE